MPEHIAPANNAPNNPAPCLDFVIAFSKRSVHVHQCDHRHAHTLLQLGEVLPSSGSHRSVLVAESKEGPAIADQQRSLMASQSLNNRVVADKKQFP
jgi:hypothetical protein